MQPSHPAPTIRHPPDAVPPARIIGTLRDAFCDVVLGGACAGCGHPGRALCGECAGDVARWTPRRVDRAGFGPAVVATTYEGLAADLLVAHKDRDAVALSAPLGAALACAIEQDAVAVAAAHGGARLLLVPVPSSRSARRRRGYDHTLRLARAAARILRRDGLEARAAMLLERGHRVRDQAELGVDERARNQRGSMRMAARVRRGPGVPGPGDAVVVVDDIITTGATVLESVRALRAGGVGVQLVAAVAHTPLRWPAGTNRPLEELRAGANAGRTRPAHNAPAWPKIPDPQAQTTHFGKVRETRDRGVQDA